MEDAFIAGMPKRRIASQHGVSERAVRYHMREHLPALLALARDAERAARADTLLDRMEGLQSRTLAILEATEETHDHRSALAAIQLNAEWRELRGVIVTALEPHPAARDSVLRALEGGT